MMMANESDKYKIVLSLFCLSFVTHAKLRENVLRNNK